jgi:hypothetical protein
VITAALTNNVFAVAYEPVNNLFYLASTGFSLEKAHGSMLSTSVTETFRKRTAAAEQRLCDEHRSSLKVFLSDCFVLEVWIYLRPSWGIWDFRTCGICPGSSVPLIYGWASVVRFMVRTRRIRERVCQKLGEKKN